MLRFRLRDSINYSATRYSIAATFYRMGELDSAEVYLKESLNTSNISRIRTSNLALYYIAKKQSRYDEAFQYIEQYRLYNDSINKMERTRAIAEAQKKYDNEKLESEKKDLLLEKGRLQKSLFGGIIILVMIALGYQRKLWLKERRLRKSDEEIQEYISNMHDNEEKMLQKQALIQAFSKDLEDKGNLEGLVNEQEEQIDLLRSDMEYLRTQNSEYQCKINEYIHSAKQKEEKIIRLEKLSSQCLSYKNREIILIDYINNHVDLFKALRDSSHQPIDWGLLYESLDILHNGFYMRLQKSFPYLKREDLQVCCLIRNGLTTSQIANIFGISGASVTKKKHRIRERMNQSLEEGKEFYTTLDSFLMNY